MLKEIVFVHINSGVAGKSSHSVAVAVEGISLANFTKAMDAALWYAVYIVCLNITRELGHEFQCILLFSRRWVFRPISSLHSLLLHPLCNSSEPGELGTQ